MGGSPNILVPRVGRSCPHRIRAPFPYPSICCGLWADSKTVFEISTVRAHCGRWAGPQTSYCQESVGAVRIEFGLHPVTLAYFVGYGRTSKTKYEISTMRVHCGRWAGPQTSYLQESVGAVRIEFGLHSLTLADVAGYGRTPKQFMK